MKKITILVFVSLMTMVSLAQDIIITTNKEKIEAKVEEVSSSTIKYKKYSYLDGPTYILETEKIVCVAYENDDVDLMTTTTKESQRINNLPTANTLNNENLSFITRTNGLYTLYDENNTTPMDKKAYMNFIQKNSPLAWSEWKQGTTLMNTGWGMLAGGITSTFAIGLTLILVDNSWNMWEAGMAFIIIGPCVTIASIPLLAVGASKRNNSYKAYNQQSVPQLMIGGTSNGLGVRIAF